MSEAANRGIVWVNGEITDFESASVALEDRGFEFGDGIYEVARTYDGRFFALRQHLERLEQSAAGIELVLPMATESIEQLAHELLRKSGLSDAELYLQITRGAGRRSHLPAADLKPTVVIGVRPPRFVAPQLWEKGCNAITLDDERWTRCNLKTICLLPNILAKQKADRAGAFEALLIRNGSITEGTSSNVLLRRGPAVVTPAADNRILAGITRSVALDLARRIGYQVIERDVPVAELFEADEAIITSTSIELMPVTRINDQLVGDGKPGPAYARLHAAFRSLTGGGSGQQ